MLPYDKYWLEHEILKIKHQSEYDKRKKRDGYIMAKYLICLGLVFFAALSADNFQFTCPHCKEEIEMAVKPGTWKCSCGYENDNRMRYCSLCGSER